jgi:type II secretory pathway pseudopilin PulG
MNDNPYASPVDTRAGKRRSGVTLLEVLFAIGIVSVGILGVMASLVVAGKQAADGARLDGADRLGRNAIREFTVRAINRARGPRGTWSLPYVSPSAPHFDAALQDGYAYCLDPLYVVANGTSLPASLLVLGCRPGSSLRLQ